MSAGALIKMAEVSVIIPTFNRPTLLEEAVQSVLAQTSPARQIIIIDDGSKAEYRSRISDMARFGPQIFIYHFPSNKGVSSARNFGLEKVKGDYILFLDDDDLLHPRMLESCLSVFRQDPAADVVTCLSRAFIDNRSSEVSHKSRRRERTSELLSATYPLNHPDYVKLERITLSSLMHFTLIINSCLVKKDCVENVRFPADLTAGEDTYFWMILASQGRNFMLNRQPYAYVRFHDQSFRLRVGYCDDTIRFFKKLLSNGLLRDREDVFLAHAHLVLKLFAMKKPETTRHLLSILGCPDLILKYLHSYYSKGARRMRRLYEFLEESRKSCTTNKGKMPGLPDFEYEDPLKKADKQKG
jgi:glycosyltransferase involved in cell wall biosynthesis